MLRVNTVRQAGEVDPINKHRPIRCLFCDGQSNLAPRVAFHSRESLASYLLECYEQKYCLIRRLAEIKSNLVVIALVSQSGSRNLVRLSIKLRRSNTCLLHGHLAAVVLCKTLSGSIQQKQKTLVTFLETSDAIYKLLIGLLPLQTVLTRSLLLNRHFCPLALCLHVLNLRIGRMVVFFHLITYVFS